LFGKLLKNTLPPRTKEGLPIAIEGRWCDAGSRTPVPAANVDEAMKTFCNNQKNRAFYNY